MAADAEEGKRSPTTDEIDEETRRGRRLQIVVSLALGLISQADIALDDANDLFLATRRIALRLFPDKGDTFDLLYRPKFQRLMDEVYRLP